MIKYEKNLNSQLVDIACSWRAWEKYSEYIEYGGIFFAFSSSGIVINVLKYIERKESNNGTRISN